MCFRFCISNDEFLCLLGATFFNSSTHLIHKKSCTFVIWVVSGKLKGVQSSTLGGLAPKPSLAHAPEDSVEMH